MRGKTARNPSTLLTREHRISRCSSSSISNFRRGQLPFLTDPVPEKATRSQPATYFNTPAMIREVPRAGIADRIPSYLHVSRRRHSRAIAPPPQGLGQTSLIATERRDLIRIVTKWRVMWERTDLPKKNYLPIQQITCIISILSQSKPSVCCPFLPPMHGVVRIPRHAVQQSFSLRARGTEKLSSLSMTPCR